MSEDKKEDKKSAKPLEAKPYGKEPGTVVTIKAAKEYKKKDHK